MKRIYLKAILIGAGLGLFALISAALFGFNNDLKIPLWDSGSYFQFGLLWQIPQANRLRDLQHQAVCLRACMIFLQSGFYYFALPIALCCLFAKLEEFGEEYLGLTCLRKTLKLSGLVLLLIWIVFGAICMATWASDIRSLEAFFIAVISLFWTGLIIAFVSPIAYIVLIVSFWLQMSMMYRSEEEKLTQALLKNEK